MEVIKVSKSDTAVINDILQNHIDDTDRRESAIPNTNLDKLLDDDRCYLLAAIADERVVGYTLAYRFPSLYAAESLAYLYDIEVSPEHRRKGVGRLLIETLILHLKEDGVKEMWLGTGVDNEAGHALYNATGAIKSEETFNDYTYYL
jgi:ribosomal protein S18 acetylase RimI-like enzyme